MTRFPFIAYIDGDPRLVYKFGMRLLDRKQRRLLKAEAVRHAQAVQEIARADRP